MGNSSSSEGVRLRFLDGCPKIPQAPADDQVQLRFDELLLFACTDSELRDELNSAESNRNKWAYAFLSKFPHGNEWLDPREYVELLQRYRSENKCAHDLILAIRINILLRPRTWVEEFIADNGVEELVTHLHALGGTSIDTCNEVITTLFVLANSSVGVSTLLKSSQGCRMLYSIYDTISLNDVKMRVLKLLGIVRHDSTMAKEAVLSAFTSNSPEDMFLQSLASQLKQDHSDIKLQFATLKFVNTLLETTRDHKRRAAICQNFKTHGIFTLLEPYKGHDEDRKALLTSSMEAQVAVLFKNYDDVVAEDNLRASRLSLGDVLNGSLGRSNHKNLTKTSRTSNQGENDEASDMARPELEEMVDTSPAIRKSTDMDTDSLKLGLATSSAQNSSLEIIINQLQQQTKLLDRQTNKKLANLLHKLVVTLSDTSEANKAVDRLITSLCLDDLKKPMSDVKSEHEPFLCTSVEMALLPNFNEPSTSIVKPPTSGQAPFFSRFGDFSFNSLASFNPASFNPANISILKPSLANFLGAESAIRSTDYPAKRSVKLSLPCLQSSGKGSEAGVTLACTPVATVSVRKDAKRPLFSSFTSPPRNLPLVPSHANESLAVTPLGPVAPFFLGTRPPLDDIAKAHSPLQMVKPLGIEHDHMTYDTVVEVLVTKMDIVKFRKLLSMGVPREAVHLKMQQANVNPDLLEGYSPRAIPRLALSETTRLDISKSLRPLFQADKENTHPIKLSPQVVDPSVAGVRANARSSASSPLQEPPSSPGNDGLNSVPLAITPSKKSPPGLIPSKIPVKLKATADSKNAKVCISRSMGAPYATEKAKKNHAGLHSTLRKTCVPTNAAPTSSLPKDPRQNSRALLSTIIASHVALPSVLHTKVKNEPSYAKFFKLLSMGAPRDSVKAKMQIAGLQPELLDTPDAMFEVASDVPALQLQLRAKDDPLYSKLLSQGAPVESLKAKMQMVGLIPDLLDTPNASVFSEDTQAAQEAQVKVQDDPAYAKFFKLLTMGAPAEGVKAKMRMAGLQGHFLDTPNAFIPKAVPVTQSAPPALITTAARRAHLSIAIIPALKAKTRAFYWQYLQAEAIKGTIWEELEIEHGNQSNQELVTLSDCELKILESEFPPPAACGPGTGSRRGVGSGFLTPGGPASPLASPKVIFLIDRARSNNISIIIKQFKMNNAALRVAIMRMDSELLTLDRVHGLIKMLPTEDEIVAISTYQGDSTVLNGAELVLKELITVPRLKQRLSALETKHQFPALVRDLQMKFNRIRMASNEIAQSSELKAILLVILQVGNKMNHNTIRGEAKGFGLNDLTKLVQVKSIDKSVTLLHFVARMIRAKKSNVVRLEDSLTSLYDVQSISIPELLGDMNKITDVTESINVELAAQRLKNRIEKKEEIDLFVETMTTFVDNALHDVATLKTDSGVTLRLVRDIMLRFDKSENEEGVAAPDGLLTSAMLSRTCEFYSIIYAFTMSFMKADRENESKRIREEKRLKQQELKYATLRKSPIDCIKLIVNSTESPRSKSLIVTPRIAIFQTKDVLLPLSEASTYNASIPTSEILPSSIKANGNPMVIDGTLVEEKTGPKRTESRTSVLKLAESPLKPSVLPSDPASPVKKTIEIIPVGIPSQNKIKRTGFSAFANRSAVPFDAASLNRIKSQLKKKRGTNNEPQLLHGTMPEVKVEGDEEENNNSEPSSPERSFSEADSSYVHAQSDV